MADKELLEILGQGIEVWNKWMKDHPDRGVDFSLENFEEADFSGIDFSEIYLDDSNFRNAILHRANFSGSELTRAILSGADLSNADLQWANLGGSKLHNTNFSNANLSEANLGPYPTKVWMDYQDKILTYNTELISTNFSSANLTEANLSNTDLTGAILKNANLHQANLNNANLSHVDFRGTRLSQASFVNANLSGANLSGVDLRSANLSEANLNHADLTGASLQEANLCGAYLCETNFNKANLTGCRIYGIAAWGVHLENTIQSNLIITRDDEPTIFVDNIEIAQFIYLLLHHEKLRDILNTVTEKGVLLLGRFSDGGIALLQTVASKLREMKYLPIIFDFDRPDNRNYTETVKTLVGLSRFVIADLSGPSVPQELYSTVPHFKIPFVPILNNKGKTYVMFTDLLEYPWVLPIVKFSNQEELLELLPLHIIALAEDKLKERQALLRQLFGD